MASLAPAITKGIELITKAFTATKQFLSNHPGIKMLIGTVGGAAIAFGSAAAAMTAWGLAAGKLSAAIKLVNGALAVFKMSNPWILAIGAAGAAVGGLIAYLNKGEKAVQDFSRKCEEQTQKHKEQADANNALMNRLQELADKQNKSAEEMAEAEAICQRLNSAYGDLGLSVDKATGSINGLTEAQKKMAAAQKATQIADIKAEINSLKQQRDASDKEAQKWSSRQERSGNVFKGGLWGRVYSQEKYNQARRNSRATTEQIQAKEQYLRELENGVDLEKTAAPGAVTPAEPAAPVDTADSERNRLESVRNQASRIGVSDYDLAKRDAAEAFKKTEEDALKVKEADIAGGMSGEEAEARFKETMDAATKIYADAVAEANEKRAKEEQRLADERAREAKEAADEIERARKEREKAQEEEMRKIADQQRKEQEYQKERNKILSQNINDGIKESATVKGTFSAFESSSDNGYQQKILKANEQVQKFTKKMYEELVQLNEKYAAGYTT
jgi:hypothetical protein